jgi:hypothetical protein
MHNIVLVCDDLAVGTMLKNASVGQLLLSAL